MHVNFNFQVDPNGVLRTEQQFQSWRWSNTVSADSTFRSVVSGQSSRDIQCATVSTTDAVQGETICIIGHPQGVPKRVEAGTVFSIERQSAALRQHRYAGWKFRLWNSSRQ